MTNRLIDPVPRVPWPDLFKYLKQNWAAGEHASIFGMTDGGKSYLETRGLLPIWLLYADAWKILIIDSKAGLDSTLRGVGIRVPKLPGATRRRIDAYFERVWADKLYRLELPAAVEETPRARRATLQALRMVQQEGRWVIIADEVRQLADPRAPNLGLMPWFEALWLRGRPRLTLIAGTQRPSWAPPPMYSQCTHAFICGRVMDVATSKRLGEIGGDVVRIRQAVSQLKRDEFLYAHRATGELLISKVGKGRPPLPRVRPQSEVLQ